MAHPVNGPAFAALSVLAALGPSASLQAQPDLTPPRIVTIAPGPAGGIHDRFGIQTLLVQFSEPVLIEAPPHSWGVGGGFASFTTTYLSTERTLRIDFAPALEEARVTVVLGQGITDLAGNPLDGEIVEAQPAVLPSGDGVAGGLAVFRYDILTGDANGDGIVNNLDAATIIAAFGTCTGDANFSFGADLNRDGCVNVLDVTEYLAGQGGMLPTLDGTPPVIQALQRADGAPLTADLETLAVTFSETIDPRSVIDGVVTFQSLAGGFHAPVETRLLKDGRSLECRFVPPLTACGNYTAHVSNGIADLSGELYVQPTQPPRFSGSAPPPTPVLNPYLRLTAGSGVTLSGTIPPKVGFAQAASVRIQGPDQVLNDIPVGANGAFTATMPLEPNEINYLHVSTISPCGIASAPIVAEVARDILPPNLAVQFPPDNTQTFDAAVNVGGTIGDTISGFEGLAVSVNGRPAAVDIGIGQNGTWVVQKLALNKVGVPTTLTIVATDVLGNTVTSTRTITRIALPNNAPTIQPLAGDDQAGIVRVDGVLAGGEVTRGLRDLHRCDLGGRRQPGPLQYPVAAWVTSSVRHRRCDDPGSLLGHLLGRNGELRRRGRQRGHGGCGGGCHRRVADSGRRPVSSSPAG